jgi:tRNA A-37 threonylcarbamoyl transferase component Bud32
VLALALAVLCALAGVAGGLLLHQRLDPPYVNASVFTAARTAVQDLYAYDYKDSKGSIARKLGVLTGQLHDQYQKDLTQGGMVDAYQQVSATTSFDVVDVGLVQVNDSQDAATVVVFGQYKVKSVNSGTQPAPQGSECTVTTDGAQSCTQTVQVHEVRVKGDWKIDDLTLKTTS